MAKSQADIYDRGQPGRSKPPRIRDIRRVGARKEEEAKIWSEKMEVSDRTQELLAQARTGGKNNRQYNKRTNNLPRPSTSETPPNDDIRYDGLGTGSTPVALQASHNLDQSGYIPLIQATYEQYGNANTTFARAMPYSMWQHACMELLQASVLSQMKLNTADPNLAYQPDPIVAGCFNEIEVPVAIHEYIRHYTLSNTITGELVTLNLPQVAFPCGPRPAQGATAAIEAGSFGPVTADTHNVYECYLSPYITKSLVARTLEVNNAVLPPQPTQQQRAAHSTRFTTWNPLPPGYTPANGVPTPNLLGFELPMKLHQQSVQELANCEFMNDSTILGRLRHCAYIMTRFSQLVRNTSNLSHVPFGSPAYVQSPTTFVVKYNAEEVASTHRLADRISSLYSPFAFAPSTSNMANYFGYKRRRSRNAPGYCYLSAGGEALLGWEDTMNHNYLMEGVFAPRNMLTDRGCLRTLDHKETLPAGQLKAPISQWIIRHFASSRT